MKSSGAGQGTFLRAAPEEVLVPGFGEKVKAARERRGLRQEELAQRLRMKESVLHKVETGNFEPDLVLARRIEHVLGIRILEQTAASKVSSAVPSSPAELTLEHVAVVRRRSV
ncbi:MAG: multiprotein-bridging factor 1 family protein [Nitrosarchaeum sp.]|nr:multiprotein-bridging factor 1 family protein [Nitrosarchaeum sp.]